MGKHSDVIPAKAHKTLLACGLVLGVGAATTLAVATDAAWVGGVFNTKPSSRSSIIQLQSALSPDGFNVQDEGFTLQAARGIQELNSTDFTAKVALQPGQFTYFPVYLRTSVDTDLNADVSVTKAQNSNAATAAAIWGDKSRPGFVTYGARLQQLDAKAPAPECSLDTFNLGNPATVRLFGSDPVAGEAYDGLVPMETGAPSTQFALAEAGQNTFMVCFRFYLDSRVITEAPEVNGAPFQPSWTFTGEATNE